MGVDGLDAEGGILSSPLRCKGRHDGPRACIGCRAWNSSYRAAIGALRWQLRTPELLRLHWLLRVCGRASTCFSRRDVGFAGCRAEPGMGLRAGRSRVVGPEGFAGRGFVAVGPALGFVSLRVVPAKAGTQSSLERRMRRRPDDWISA